MYKGLKARKNPRGLPVRACSACIGSKKQVLPDGTIGSCTKCKGSGTEPSRPSSYTRIVFK